MKKNTIQLWIGVLGVMGIAFLSLTSVVDAQMIRKTSIILDDGSGVMTTVSGSTGGGITVGGPLTSGNHTLLDANGNKTVLKASTRAAASPQLNFTLPNSNGIGLLLDDNSGNTSWSIGGASTVLAVDAGGNLAWTNTLPAVSGANLTNLNASNITTGSLSSGMLPAGVVIANGTPAAGDMLYWTGTEWDRLPVGAHANGEVLTLGSGAPNWSPAGSIGNSLSTLTLTGASNQLILQPGGAGNAFTFTGTNPGQATTIHWDDPGVPSTGIVYTHNANTQDIVGRKTFQNLGMHDSALTGVSGTLILNASNTSMFSISSAAADFTIGKITGGYDGKRLRIYNKSGKNMTLKNGTGTDSLYTYANGDITLTADGAVSLVHDGTRWTGDSYTANNVIGTIGSTSYAIDGRTLGQSVTGTGMTDHDSLQITVQGGQVWEIQGTMIVSGDANSTNMKWTVTTPASSTQTISYSSYQATNGASSLQGAGVLTTSGTNLGVDVGTSTTFIDYRGLIVVGSGGAIKLRFASSVGGGTINMAKNSYMRVTRIR
jgi:hypothetical protein